MSPLQLEKRLEQIGDRLHVIATSEPPEDIVAVSTAPLLDSLMTLAQRPSQTLRFVCDRTPLFGRQCVPL